MFDETMNKIRMAHRIGTAMAETKFMKNERAASGGGLLGMIAALSIGAYLLAYLFLPAVVALAGGNTTGLSTAQIALIGLIVVVVIIAVVIVVLKQVGIKL